VKQRKEFEKPAEKLVKKESNKTVQELTLQIQQIVGKNPDKAAKAVEFLIKENSKNGKRVA
jgi:hypothetical protein